MDTVLEVAVVDLPGDLLDGLREDVLRHLHPIKIVGIGCFRHRRTQFTIFRRQAAEEPIKVSTESASDKQGVGLVAVLNGGKESELAENPHVFSFRFRG